MRPKSLPGFGAQAKQNERLQTLARLVDAVRYADVVVEARALSALLPRHPFVLKALSFGLLGIGEYDQALAVLQRALPLAPNDPELHNNFGIALSATLRSDEALVAFERSLALDPTDFVTWKNQGAAFYQMRRFDDAIASLVKAIELHPDDYDEAIDTLSMALLEAGRLDEAVVCLQALVDEAPDNLAYRSRLAWALQRLCDWTDADVRIEALRRDSDGFARLSLVPFYALGLAGVSACEQRRVAEVHARANIPAEIFERPPLHRQARRGERPRLRIGYLSFDYKNHPVAHVLPRVFELHDRSRVEIVAYSTGPYDGSAIRQRLAAGCDRFVDIAGLGMSSGAQRIADDAVDILVDLQGWTSGDRAPMLAMRPAPIQVNWLGYAGTMGSARLADYIVGDPVVVAPGSEHHYAERVVRMPHCYLPMDPTQAVGNAPGRADAGLPDQGFVFCSFNNSYKFNPVVFDAWCRLLREVPDSCLWLTRPAGKGAENLRREALARGIAAERIVFAPRREARADYLGQLQLADLALDTAPYNSHSSGMDTLWAGVPMITLLGDTFAGRVGASLVTAAGIPDCVAADWDEYVALAQALARDRPRLAALRQRLAAQRASAPLFDMAAFTRDLEDLYFGMWRGDFAELQPATR